VGSVITTVFIIVALVLRVVWLKRTGYLVDVIILGYHWSFFVDAVALFTADIGYLLHYLISALVVFILSTVISCASVTGAGAYLKGLSRVRYLENRVLWRLTATHLLTAIYEEVIWRVIILVVVANYTNSLFAVIFVSCLFFYIHLHRFYSRPQAIEFLIFSMLLSTVYLTTNSLLHVIVVHFVRNLLIGICSKRGDYDEKNIHLSRTN